MKYIASFLMLFCFTACDKGFDDINTNPATANKIPPEYLFTNALLSGALNNYQSDGAILAYSSCFIQHFASVEFDWHGDKYTYSPFNGSSLFLDGYRNEVKTIVELLRIIENQPDKQNLQSMARIWKTVIFHRLTDFYGDVPYSEAGLAFAENIYAPVYDPQKSIYENMLVELEAACTELDVAKPTPGPADILYDGNIEKWRRFGYSMMLRLAMRLTKADPVAAEAWSKKALAGGIMNEDGHSALVLRSDGPADFNKNGISLFLDVNDNGRVCKTLVDWLVNHNDPRIGIYAWQKLNNDWIGLPHGREYAFIKDSLKIYNIDTFARINPKLLKMDAPSIIMSAAEPAFLAAEACLRGWSSGDPVAYYQSGVRAAMKMWMRFDATLELTDVQVNDYLVANPLSNGPGEAIRFLNEQYWVATYLNELESFANWRRSGYPVLIPSNHSANVTNGTIPRRLPYPQQEYSVNSTNIIVAIQRQGPDEMTTRVWWDK